MIVAAELTRLDIPYETVEIGLARTLEVISGSKLNKVKNALLLYGLELIDDKKSILADKVKSVVLEMVQNSDTPVKTNFSDYLSAKLNHSYTYLSNTFSEVHGTTIEQFIIRNKVQRVKELIRHNELNLTEISWKLHYSSVAHLSTQFKKVTGESPSHFKLHAYRQQA
ncbi:MAG TPA: helix-turn-helix transcriptional regulator [Sphingobacteriaceae bacterium]